MARQRKIAIVGARGYNDNSAEVRVSSYPWNRLDEITNLSDFDTVILNLLSVPGNVNWNRFAEILNIQSMNDIVEVGGNVIVIGDPRFRITGNNLDQPFLNWTAIDFVWDEQSGDTIEFSEDWSYKDFFGYLRHLKHWDYALRHCALCQENLSQLFNLDALAQAGRRLSLVKNSLALNRYKEDLAFSVKVIIERNEWSTYGDRWKVEHQYGSLTFLPKISVSEDETLVTVLRDICGVDAGAPEPEWIAAREAPGQDRIDARISEIESRIEVARDELKGALEERDSMRECLRLLYERGRPLEIAVRAVLRELGASVEDPQEAGKEDGWISATVGGKSYEGVLEVKSTKSEEFDEYGLKQLLEWIHRGVQMRGKKYKGIFVGSNSVDEPAGKRKAGFGPGWRKSSELHNLVAIRTEDLYGLYELSKAGKLNSDAFWNRFFNTDGIFDPAEFISKDK